MPVPPPGQRRDRNGQQWCYDLNQPCIRIDLGGPWPHCQELMALNDLFDQPEKVTAR